MGAVGLAFAAGVLSFSSPCCLPLMPGYLSYVSGVAGEGASRGRVVGSAALFVLGFTIVFSALGASASVLGSLLLSNRSVLVQVAGGFVVLMGLAAAGLLRLPFLHREKRPALHRIRTGPAGAVPLGMAFALGWTPCIGPVLAAILTAAAATASLQGAMTLLLVYSLGLGTPFLLLALGYSKAGKTFSWLRRHGGLVERAGGVVLVAMGVLMITGMWTKLFTPLIRLFSRVGWPPI